MPEAYDEVVEAFPAHTPFGRLLAGMVERLEREADAPDPTPMAPPAIVTRVLPGTPTTPGETVVCDRYGLRFAFPPVATYSCRRRVWAGCWTREDLAVCMEQNARCDSPRHDVRAAGAPAIEYPPPMGG